MKKGFLIASAIVITSTFQVMAKPFIQDAYNYVQAPVRILFFLKQGKDCPKKIIHLNVGPASVRHTGHGTINIKGCCIERMEIRNMLDDTYLGGYDFENRKSIKNPCSGHEIIIKEDTVTMRPQ